jgi:hypothetical protein
MEMEARIEPGKKPWLLTDNAIVAVIWHGSKISLYENAAPITVFVVAGVAAKVFFFYWMTFPFFTLAASVFVARFIIEIGKKIEEELLNEILKPVEKIDLAYPYLYKIGVVFSVSMGFLFPLCSFVLSVSTGSYIAIRTNAKGMISDNLTSNRDNNENLKNL